MEDYEYPNGLIYVDDFISDEEHDFLLQNIDSRPFSSELKRKVQHYGHKYDYKMRNIDYSYSAERIPDFLSFLTERVVSLGIIMPDQLIVNNYEPGQGISPHIDKTDIFEDNIWCVSLISDIVMSFNKGKEIRDLLLKKNSLLILSGESRYQWTHSIASRKEDIINGEVISRGRRVSLTFRKVRN